VGIVVIANSAGLLKRIGQRTQGKQRGKKGMQKEGVSAKKKASRIIRRP
jgi:hypothetical protein